MQKRNYMEISGILALSFILTSSLAVSSCLPEMFVAFPDHSRSSVEMLMSVPAFSMIFMIAASPVILKYCKERIMITTGLLIYGITGIAPLFFPSFSVIFLSRLFMGIGLGLLNTKAVSMIGERFSGNLQQRLQGIRCSMETLGQAALTMIAGQLLGMKWNYAFLIYGTGFLILLMYLKFVPERTEASDCTVQKTKITYKMAIQEWIIILQNAILGGIIVCSSVTNSLRIASYVTEKGLGTDVNGATILSISTLVGFLSGLIFGNLIKTFKQYMLPFSLCVGAIGFATIAFSNSLVMVTIGTAICGFAVTSCTSFIFNRLSTRLPVKALDIGNSMVLVGCNLGVFATPFVLRIINIIKPDLSAGFLTFAILYLTLSIVALIRNLYYTRKKI